VDWIEVFSLSSEPAMLVVLRRVRFFQSLMISLTFLGGFLMSGNAIGQMESMRFELGRRLTRFERAWEAANPKQRAACV
jgi:hypothetical protein